jgi:hypothetical protein
MTTFTITIENTSHLAGISAARSAYNDSINQVITDDLGNEVPNPELINTDAEYVQFVMSRAAESYANQYGV